MAKKFDSTLVIARAKELLSSGYTISATARTLGSENLSTPQGKKWSVANFASFAKTHGLTSSVKSGKGVVAKYKVKPLNTVTGPTDVIISILNSNFLSVEKKAALIVSLL